MYQNYVKIKIFHQKDSKVNKKISSFWLFGFLRMIVNSQSYFFFLVCWILFNRKRCNSKKYKQLIGQTKIIFFYVAE